MRSPGTAARTPQCDARGLLCRHSAYAVTEADWSQEGGQVMPTPLGARPYIGFPPAEAGGRPIDLADLFSSAAREAI